MKELMDIIESAKRAEGPTALATIIQTGGSSYRHAGARMLVFPDGRSVGCISGGCLDRDVVAKAMEVLQTQEPALITYDTRREEDILLGTGLGCKGVIDIFVERLAPGSNFLLKLEDSIRQRSITASATVISASACARLKPGDRLLLDNSGNRSASTADARAVETLAEYARAQMESAQPRLVSLDDAAGAARIFVETIFPQTNLAIFGAGHDAMPLARLAHELGLRTIIIDGRTGYATKQRFPTAAEILVLSPEELLPGKLFDARSAAVIMTHNYLIDQSWLRSLLPMGLPYLGLMGPRKRAEKMLMELSAEGQEVGGEQMGALHNPVGLDIGAETPEQIALAILSEVQATLASREGGKLKNNKGNIHMQSVNTTPERKPWAVSA